MSWITVHDIVHHVANPDELGAVAACGQGNRKLDALGVPFWSAEMCATSWEHVTCPACKAKQPLSCKVSTMSIKLPESFQGINGNLHALAAVPLSQTDLVWTALSPSEQYPLQDFEKARLVINCVPSITEEPAPAPEPEQPQRSEGDDLLDFFKGGS